MTVLIILTLISIIVAVAMSVVALRTTAEERRRSDARVARLTADIFAPVPAIDAPTPTGAAVHSSEAPDFDLRPAIAAERAHAPVAREHHVSVAHAPVVDAPAAPMSADLFTSTQPEPSGSRFATAAVFGVLVVGSLATVALLMSSGSHRASAATSVESRAGETGAAAAARVEPAPLELVALGHERVGDHLTVRGVIRNPSSGAAVDGLAAVVFLFGRDGNFITSSRTDVETTHLGPGGESRFVVNVPTAADIGRYRVSFRTDDRVIPHVDRREPALARR